MVGKTSRAMAGVVAGAMALSVCASDVDSESAPFLELRYRYSNLATDARPMAGHANTVRLQFGYLWAFGDRWKAYAEGTQVTSLFGRQYDDGSGRHSRYPVEADPKASGVTSAWLGYTQDGFELRVGRQYVRLDDGRFFSNNGWRQYPQSFDGVSVTWRPWQGGELRYDWLGQVNRTVGDDFFDRNQRRWVLNAHLLHFDQALAVGTLTTYGYFVRNDTLASNSVRTMGVRWKGSTPLGSGALGWTTELARQYNYENNPARFDLPYHLLEMTYGSKQVAIKAGEERLGGDGTTAFNVAYGAARAFNGWVVAFRIPRRGLQERYVGLFGTTSWARAVDWQVTYRHFMSAQGGPVLGNELDAGVRVDVGMGFSLEAQYGDYRASAHEVDERKVWLIAQYRWGKPVL